MDKPRRKKATRKQREERRALNAKIFNEGFQKGWELCEQFYRNKISGETTSGTSNESIREGLRGLQLCEFYSTESFDLKELGE